MTWSRTSTIWTSESGTATTKTYFPVYQLKLTYRMEYDIQDQQEQVNTLKNQLQQCKEENEA